MITPFSEVTLGCRLKGMLKRAASGVPCLRASFAEVATKAESGFAQAGRHLAVLTYFFRTLRSPKWLRLFLEKPQDRI
jgi:hypothetical protein